MSLSKFFTLAEMSRSDTATRLGISNQPTPEAEENLRTLCAAVLDPLRESTGAAINISSGYRGPELNARIGGAKKSQHMEGKAADIQSHGMSVLDLFKAVIRLGLPFDQVIYEAKNRTSKWVHVSHDPARARGAILVADFGPDGKVLQYRNVTAQQALEIAEPATRSAVPDVWEFEEIADEPDSFEVAEEMPRDDAPVAPRIAKPRKATPRAKAKPKTKKKDVAKRKSARKVKAPTRKVARRKSAAKRSRPRARKHK